MKKRFRKILPYIIFLLGFLILSYPFIAQRYYRIQSDKEVSDFFNEAKKIPSKEIQERLELAHAYNKTLDPSRISDPWTEKEKAGRRNYAKMLEVKERIGIVEIPRISQTLPVYAGTSMEVLDKAVGHLEGTSLPVGGKSTHAVITAHRGLPEKRLFTDLDKMKKGDVFFIHILDKKLAYKVDQILVVEPNDFEPVLVKENKDYLTLLTCTPYSINTHRLLVRGERLENFEEYMLKPDNEALFVYRQRLFISLIIIIILLIIIIRNRYKIKQISNK